MCQKHMAVLQYPGNTKYRIFEVAEVAMYKFIKSVLVSSS